MSMTMLLFIACMQAQQPILRPRIEHQAPRRFLRHELHDCQTAMRPPCLQAEQQQAASYHAEVDKMKAEHERFMSGLQQENGNLQAKLSMLLAQLEGAQAQLTKAAADSGTMVAERDTLQSILVETRQTAKVGRTIGCSKSCQLLV
jgi:chromosome segregation ATPase